MLAGRITPALDHVRRYSDTFSLIEKGISYLEFFQLACPAGRGLVLSTGYHIIGGRIGLLRLTRSRSE